MSSRSGWGRFCEAGRQGSARPTRALGGSVGLGSFFGAAVATRADAGRLHEKSRSPLAEGLSLDGWEAAARVSARGPREPAGVGLRKGERTSAGGAPGRGGGKRGAGRVPGRRGGVGTRGVCTEGPRRARARAEAEPAETRAAAAVWGCGGASPRAWPRAGPPSLTCRDAAAEGGAPSVASAAAWAGAGQSATRRLGASSARARGVGGVGAGRRHKARLSEGRYGERRGAQCLGRAQSLKRTVCCARFLLKSVNPKSEQCRPFFTCTF